MTFLANLAVRARADALVVRPRPLALFEPAPVAGAVETSVRGDVNGHLHNALTELDVEEIVTAKPPAASAVPSRRRRTSHTPAVEPDQPLPQVPFARPPAPAPPRRAAAEPSAQAAQAATETSDPALAAADSAGPALDSDARAEPVRSRPTPAVAASVAADDHGPPPAVNEPETATDTAKRNPPTDLSDSSATDEQVAATVSPSVMTRAANAGNTPPPPQSARVAAPTEPPRSAQGRRVASRAIAEGPHPAWWQQSPRPEALDDAAGDERDGRVIASPQVRVARPSPASEEPVAGQRGVSADESRHPPEPPVQVTIGRVDVRAAAAPAPHSQRPATAALSLDEHLRQRTAGRR